MKSRLIKSPVSVFLFAFLLLCCSCQVKDPGDPASSRVLTFDEIFSLSEESPVVLADVAVREVYPDICEDECDGEKYILASGKIQNSFFVSPSCPNQEILSAAESDCLLWIRVNGIQEQYYAELQELIKQADSLIIYADDEPALVGRGGLDEEVLQTLKEYGFDCSIAESNLTASPSLYIKAPYMWSVIPIIDGVADGTVVQRAIEDSHYAEMVYDMEIADATRISSGDTIEDIYTFLNGYVERSSK